MKLKKIKQLVKTLFSRQWWWVTLIVILLMIILARLGVWQLDRLQQRRESNLVLAAALASSPLDLTVENLPEDTASLKNRKATASGTYDFEHQVMLKVQNWQGTAGAHLITPLVFAGGESAVLVDRGWIPETDNNPDGRAKYNVESEVQVNGSIAQAQTLKEGTSSAAQGPQEQWYRVDIEGIQKQMPYKLLPIYLLQAPEGNLTPPFRSEPENDLSEGNHLSYAIQWFIFSLGLGTAYVIYVNRQTQGRDSS